MKDRKYDLCIGSARADCCQFTSLLLLLKGEQILLPLGASFQAVASDFSAIPGVTSGSEASPGLPADHDRGGQPKGAPVLQAERLVRAGHRQDRAEGGFLRKQYVFQH